MLQPDNIFNELVFISNEISVFVYQEYDFMTIVLGPVALRIMHIIANNFSTS